MRILSLSALLLAPPAWAATEAHQLDLELERGAHALRQGNVEDAIPRLEAALAIDPENEGALELYTHALLVAGRSEEAAAALERLQALDPDERANDYLSGLTAYRLEDWETARTQLAAAAERRPESGVLQLLLGVSQQELGDYAGAEASLARAESLDPNLAGQVAYRRGVASYRQGSLGDADESFGQVLSTLPESSLADSAQQYRTRINEQRGQKYTVSVGIGAGYDSNANLAADSNNLDDDESDTGLGIIELNLGAVLYEEGPVRAGVTQSVDMRFHSSDDEFDLARSRTGAFGELRLHEKATFSLDYVFDQTWSGYHAFRTTNTILPNLELRIYDMGPTNVYFRMDAREYENRAGGTIVGKPPPNAIGRRLDRDGEVYSIGIDQTVKLPAIPMLGTSYAILGYRWRNERTEGTDYDADGHEPSLTLLTTLPLNTHFIFDVRHEFRKFDDRSVLEGQPSGGSDDREDDITKVYVGFQRSFSDNVDVSAGYQYSERDSNTKSTVTTATGLFDYDRHLFTIIATYNFF